jgi:streptogramin lyase
VSRWLRGGGRRRGASERKPGASRLTLEALEDRCLPSVTEFPIPTANSQPFGITRGPDGNLWFAEIGAIGRITPAGVVTEFTQGLSPGSEPVEITAGPDGNLWFTEGNTDRIGRITPAGVISEFTVPPLVPNPFGNQLFVFGITRGSDGNLWFTEQAGAIGRITPAGVVTVFAAGLTNSAPQLITAGPDGNLWFADGADKIGRITTAGVITEFSAGISVASEPTGITAGPDGNLWFTEPGNGPAGVGRIGRITPAGVVTEFSAGLSPGAAPQEITAGPDGNLWFTDINDNRFDRITTAGVITEFSSGITPGAAPLGIAVGPDGNLWITEIAGNRIGRLDLAQAATGLQQSGFETPNVGTGAFGAFAYDPAGSAWTFSGFAGVAGNGSGFTAGNPNAPQGTQVAFLQDTGSFSQSVDLAAGTYSLTFAAAQRGNFQASAQTFQVLVDGVAVGTFTPAGTSYGTFTTSNFMVAAGAHTIQFVGLNPNGGDNTAFIDNVQLLMH